MTGDGSSVVTDFAARVRALPPDAWTRMADRVPGLEGDSMAALLARSDRLSNALGDLVPAIPRMLSKPLSVLGQLAVEFRAPATESRALRWPRSSTSLTPSQRRRVEAVHGLTTLLDAKRAEYPGAVAALQSVLMTLPVRERLDSGEFERLYAFVEPEIPLDSLKADDNAV